jgi:hypothetical protein
MLGRIDLILSWITLAVLLLTVIVLWWQIEHHDPDNKRKLERKRRKSEPEPMRKMIVYPDSREPVVITADKYKGEKDE